MDIIPGKTFCNLCSLTALTTLSLISKTGVKPVLQCGITHSISRLVNLRQLVLFLGLNSDRWTLRCAPEISQLTALTHVVLAHEGSCLGRTCSIVSMQKIGLAACRNVHFTARLSMLSSLTSFVSDNCRFSGQLADISYLGNLQSLAIYEYDQPEITATQVSSLQEGIVTLRSMTCLEISLNSKLSFDSAALQPLKSLQMLSLSMGLIDFTCQSSWTSLRGLWLNCNCFTALPANLHALTALQCLSMDDQDSERFRFTTQSPWTLLGVRHSSRSYL